MKKALLTFIVMLSAYTFVFAQDAAAKEYTNQDNTTTNEDFSFDGICIFDKPPATKN